MTPTPARRARRLADLEQLESGDRIRYRGRPATILEVRAPPIAFAGTLELEVLFDDLEAPTTLHAFADRGIAAIELLPPPTVYDPQEAPE